mmetsp:Transcript_328/g.610  ORF Transcript_328/g.610 Transcript_328/m.610 type:complete len:266 (-) Transcript_328:1130-1927(-)
MKGAFFGIVLLGVSHIGDGSWPSQQNCDDFLEQYRFKGLFNITNVVGGWQNVGSVVNTGPAEKPFTANVETGFWKSNVKIYVGDRMRYPRPFQWLPNTVTDFITYLERQGYAGTLRSLKAGTWGLRAPANATFSVPPNTPATLIRQRTVTVSFQMIVSQASSPSVVDPAQNLALYYRKWSVDKPTWKVEDWFLHVIGDYFTDRNDRICSYGGLPMSGVTTVENFSITFLSSCTSIDSASGDCPVVTKPWSIRESVRSGSYLGLRV